MQVLELDGIIPDTSILTSALIASIRRMRRENFDHFVTLAHHHPRPLALTKAQLLASICRQLLMGRPKLFAQVQSLLDRSKEAIQRFNLAWKEISLWKILKVLIGGQVGGQTFIIIHQPQETVLASPFIELIADLTALVENYEISCKILATRKPSTYAPNNSLSIYLDDATLDLQIETALEKDFDAALSRIAQIKPYMSGIKRDVMSALGQNFMDLQTAQHNIAVLKSQPFLALQSVRTSLFSSIPTDVI